MVTDHRAPHIYYFCSGIEETRRIRDVIPGLPMPAGQFEDIIATCRDLDRHDRADRLIQLTLKQA